MEALERDRTQDWLLPEHAKPPLVGELEARIDEALATARASEAAVITVGAAALDAAEQAKRAADLAERASAAMLESAAANSPPPESPPAREGRGAGRTEVLGAGFADDDASLVEFSARADRLAERLRELERFSAPIG